MKNIKLAIFDLDGLMLDTERLYIEGCLAISKENNYNVTEEFLESLLGITSKDEEAMYRKHLGDDFPLDSFRESAIQLMFKRIREEGAPVKEGLLELLDFLEENKIPKVVATSRYRKEAQWLLEMAGINDRFQKKIFGDEVKHGKPSPEIFLKACEVMNISGDSAVVFEDSMNGLRAAKAAGIRCILIPDIVQPSPLEEELAYVKLKSLKEAIKLKL